MHLRCDSKCFNFNIFKLICDQKFVQLILNYLCFEGFFFVYMYDLLMPNLYHVYNDWKKNFDRV